jgi:hypothetical protein
MESGSEPQAAKYPEGGSKIGMDKDIARGQGNMGRHQSVRQTHFRMSDHGRLQMIKRAMKIQVGLGWE